MRKITHALAVPFALLLAVGLTACGDQVPVSSSDDTAVTTAAEETPAADREVESETDSVMKLQVGDCFNYDDSESTVSEVDFVSCDDPHQFEVYNNSDIDDSVHSTVPVGDALDEEIYNACFDAFEMYVGIPLSDSSYDVQSLQPTVSSWAHGDRTINCLITSQDGTELVGSARGTSK
ncbi:MULTISPECIES: septum formation family protein [unclassified Actinomyces]|uniref:septum formation family protein n=1 Tax=unclassified Actinomyces TaxID=2609248 RepID=UPI002016B645|nr:MULTISPECIES: septum formation family protein [unclassified Actinomyces]MCL3778488.1 septum formation family protein [Actinomyces sp. AC-20-1]MCL3789688.1 septum formation family protein [Actinomyces sp. 187325]MCL3792830.1 septum formation family protein [Actinomyces sp. 186855]MCL3795396.1 septum formation family protein [Actinomyces sp. 217892]